MLSYAFQALKQDVYSEVAVEKFTNIHNLFATILSKGIALQIKQGLYREYAQYQENLPVLRGKININGSIKNKLACKQCLFCEYDLLAEDNQLNKILKTTVLLLLKSIEVDEEYKIGLRKVLLFFSSVKSMEPTSIQWKNIRFQRNNQNYRLLIGICELIIKGMLLSTERGDYKLANFIDEQRMCRLYEKFILEYYKKHYPWLAASAKQIPWALDDGECFMLPKMQSDITLCCGKSSLIIDAKYYSHTTQMRFEKRTLISHNLYQIFTYVKNYAYNLRDVKVNVSGMLLYAKTDEVIQPDNVYQMHGNQISVKTLDLNRDFSKIAQTLNYIVESHFTRNDI